MTTFEILAERNNLTITESGEIKLNPLSQFEFITYPLNDKLKTLTVDKDTYYGLLLKAYQFNANLDGIEPFDPVKFNEFRKIKIAALKAAQEAKAVENGADN